MKFQFNQDQQSLIKTHIQETEGNDSPWTINQHFENDTLFLLFPNLDIPENLNEIDFSFTDRIIEN